MFRLVKKNPKGLHVRRAHIRFLSTSQNPRRRGKITATFPTTEISQAILSYILVYVNAVSITHHFTLREHCTDTDPIIPSFEVLVILRAVPLTPLKADCVRYTTRDNTPLELHH